jgi:hypothetical protein
LHRRENLPKNLIGVLHRYSPSAPIMDREAEPLLFDPDAGEGLHLRSHVPLRAEKILPCRFAEDYQFSFPLATVQTDAVNAFHSDQGFETFQVPAAHNCDEKLLVQDEALEEALPSLGKADITGTPSQRHQRSVEVEEQRPGFRASQARDDLGPGVE